MKFAVIELESLISEPRRLLTSQFVTQSLINVARLKNRNNKKKSPALKGPVHFMIIYGKW